nr:unnamed protein product [Sorex araneus]
MSLPIGMHRRAFSYDDALENPMPPPPADMGKLPWMPAPPQRPERRHHQVEPGGPKLSSPTITVSPATDGPDPAPVVKAKATHVIMNSLITKQTQESIQRFEQQAGLREAGYTPHKGLTTEETKYLRMAEALRGRAPTGAFTTQPYQGGQTPSPMELVQGPATFMTGDTSTLKPPKLDLPGTEAKKPRARSHNIKPRDLNVFTPTGF